MRPAPKEMCPHHPGIVGLGRVLIYLLCMTSPRNGIEVELNADSPASLEAMGIERRRAEAKADNSNGGDNANLEMLWSQPDPSGDNSTTRSVTFAAQTEEITVNTSSEDMSSHATSKTGADKAAPLENQETGTSDQIMVTVTRLLEAQRQMMEAQVQAMAAQSVPPLRKFCGENINTDEGSIDRWLEQFAERARVAGWSEEQKLFQLKAHLEKTAEHTVRMLPEEEKSSYSSVVVALQKRFRSLDIEELRGLEFHQLMQEKQSVEALGMELQKLGRKAFPTSSMKEFDRIVKGRFYHRNGRGNLECRRPLKLLKNSMHVPACSSDMTNNMAPIVESRSNRSTPLVEVGSYRSPLTSRRWEASRMSPP